MRYRSRRIIFDHALLKEVIEKDFDRSEPSLVRLHAAGHAALIAQVVHKVLDILRSDLGGGLVGTNIFTKDIQVATKGFNRIVGETLPTHVLVERGNRGVHRRRNVERVRDLRNGQELTVAGFVGAEKGELD